MTPDPLTVARATLAAATEAKTEELRSYYLAATKCALRDLRDALEQLERVLARREEAATAGAQPQAQLEIGGRP